MINNEAEYAYVLKEQKDLTKQYNALSQMERSRPYCGPQMLRMIYALRQELRMWENDRLKKSTGTKQD